MLNRCPFPGSRFLLLVFAASVFICTAHASNPRDVDAASFGQRIVLGPDWLFSPGDSLAWASPAYDDSGWRVVSSNRDLFEYGIHDIKYGWYRVHIHLRPGARDLMVGLEGIHGGYEVYANGERIGGNGDMAGRVAFNQLSLRAFAIPGKLLTPQGDLVLAIRFAFDLGGKRGRGTSTPLDNRSAVYLLSSSEAARDASDVSAHKAGVYFILAFLSLLAGLIALALYGALRSQREYLAVAIYLLASSGFLAVQAWNTLWAITLSTGFLESLCFGIASFALIEFVRLVLRLPRSRWLLSLEVATFVCAAVTPVFESGIGSYYFGFAFFFIPLLIVDILLPVLLVRGWRHGNREARVLLPAMLLYGLAQYWNVGRQLAYFTHLTATLHTLPTFYVGSYSVVLYHISYLVFYITILLFLVLRTVGVARRHAQVNAELEAARTVQQVLIPNQLPTIPGFGIESVYKPAGEVGGDFFQILPSASGGVLAVIGDVSGKGMPAAMTVALLVGTVRTLAHYTQSPGEILSAMNQRMMGRGNGGFTTCLVVRADPDGTLTVANAGHLAPHLEGNELALENGLPLGISSDATYPESIFQLAAGQRLTLLTDGVVEARDKAGALFGFERTLAISNQPANSIAEEAQRWGQEDDITVLTVTRAARLEAVTA
ncbi:MAG: SpoIIE family protein phosphatase [Acidobacteriota bacterium]|nr:SpoIIE family protein phosphatase [Acidobacteriota bacterium]